MYSAVWTFTSHWIGESTCHSRSENLFGVLCCLDNVSSCPSGWVPDNNLCVTGGKIVPSSTRCAGLFDYDEASYFCTTLGATMCDATLISTDAKVETGCLEVNQGAWSRSQCIGPTSSPTFQPSLNPTLFPTQYPSLLPTAIPTVFPTKWPTEEPTQQPTPEPTGMFSIGTCDPNTVVFLPSQSNITDGNLYIAFSIDYTFFDDVDIYSGSCNLRNGTSGQWVRSLSSLNCEIATLVVEMNQAFGTCAFSSYTMSLSTIFSAMFTIFIQNSVFLEGGVFYQQNQTLSSSIEVVANNDFSISSDTPSVHGTAIYDANILSISFDVRTARFTIYFIVSVSKPYSIYNNISIDTTSGWNDTGVDVISDSRFECTAQSTRCSKLLRTISYKVDSCTDNVNLTLNREWKMTVYSNCISPLICSTTQGTVSFRTYSDYYCVRRIGNVQTPSGSLELYADETYTITQIEFIVGDILYMDYVVFSFIEMEAMYLEKIDLLYPTRRVRLYDTSDLLVQSSSNLQVSTSTRTSSVEYRVRAWFKLTPELLVPKGTTRVSIRGIVRVKYINQSASGRRLLMQQSEDIVLGREVLLTSGSYVVFSPLFLFFLITCQTP